MVIIDPIISVATIILSSPNACIPNLEYGHTPPLNHGISPKYGLRCTPIVISEINPPLLRSDILEMSALCNSICSGNRYMVWCSRAFPRFRVCLPSVLPVLASGILVRVRAFEPCCVSYSRADFGFGTLDPQSTLLISSDSS